MTVTVDANAGPFLVTSQAFSETWNEGESKTITWSVAQTHAGNVNTSHVSIKITTDEGQTFTTVLASTPNDGFQEITVPNIGASIVNNARVVVEAVNNIFFSVNVADITIVPTTNSVAVNTFDNFKLFPNPSNGKFRVSFQTPYNDFVSFDLYDVRGRLLDRQKVVSNGEELNRAVNYSRLSKGVYLLRVYSSTKSTTQKVIIE